MFTELLQNNWVKQQEFQWFIENVNVKIHSTVQALKLLLLTIKTTLHKDFQTLQCGAQECTIYLF